ncbi:lysozyme [Paenibacillus tundrae]|uniref:Lysozyme n=1 Tax=Paenibacillus tundrae TaxID=528187 RepID=A0ABT9W7H2_9BACL|nr:glycoside hydrolase family protein [Paenibacillus tundrae]MDQ0169195.1 GH24 family phage-related lysozyme (muramidase) [Paenibacillus tundrae]
MFKISKVGIDLIKSFEGCKLTAYKPYAHEEYWTIGWGHYGSDVKPGQTITQAQADAMLISDLARYEAYVNNPVYVPLTNKLNQNQFDALVSFCYNTGQSNLKKLCVAPRTLAQIAAKMPEYNKAGGKVSNGLVRRRKAEVTLFNSPVKETPRPENEVTALVNGKEIEGAILIGGTVLIPLRAAGNNIPGAEVKWDKETLTARLDTPK